MNKPVDFKRFVLATGNEGKASEIRHILGLDETRLLTLKQLRHIKPPPETGDTFEENAIAKAKFCAEVTGLVSMADDSGLEVEALGGRPGVYSARYAGPKATDAKNNAKLVKELGKRDDSNRKARFVCVAALVTPKGETHVFKGECEGEIITGPLGDKGFGYDPLFVPDDGEGLTFAEMSDGVKSTISHRKKAFAAMCEHLKECGFL